MDTESLLLIFFWIAWRLTFWVAFFVCGFLDPNPYFAERCLRRPEECILNSLLVRTLKYSYPPLVDRLYIFVSTVLLCACAQILAAMLRCFDFTYLKPNGTIFSSYVLRNKVGNPAFMSDPTKELTLRVHDECNGSDVFGSDICSEYRHPLHFCFLLYCSLGANGSSLITALDPQHANRI